MGMHDRIVFRCLSVVAALAAAFGASAADVRTVELPLEAMATNLPVRVILPRGYAESTNRYPSVYLLHGAGGSCDFVSGELEQSLCDRYGVIGIAPDGTKFGWWWDSPSEPERKIETFVTGTVVPWVDRTFRTIPERTKRAIIGESMGGHGACWIGFRHLGLFGAVGNVYGGVDVRAFEGNWEISRRLGPQAENPERWREHCAITEAARLRNGDIELVTIVGTDDIFLVPNRRMHELLSANRVAHHYLEVRGPTQELSSHTHPFRKEGEKVAFRFLDNYFHTGRGSLE